MVKNDSVTSEEQIPCQHYAAALRGMHRRAGSRRKIHSSVWRPGLTVEHPAASKVTTCPDTVERQSEAALPQSVGSPTGKQFLQAAVVPFHPLGVLRTQFDELPTHLQLFDCELTGLNDDPGDATYFLPVL